MNVRLIKPAHERFIAEQVQSGQFASAEAVIEDLLDSVLNESLSHKDIASINESEERIDRGEFVDFRQLADEIRTSGVIQVASPDRVK